jgi:Arc/MetJ-type ribon-helix-helix transcriptional regulator
MPNYEFPPQVEALLQKQLETGEYATEDEVLVAALQSLQSQNDDWVAVSQALDTLDTGNPGHSLDEAVAEVRRRNDVPS